MTRSELLKSLINPLAITRTGMFVAALALSAQPATAATPLLDFQFDEGQGSTVSDKASSLTGTLGVPTDPANNPVVITDSPSGAANDRAISFNIGNDAGQGFLVIDDRNAPLLASTTNAMTMEAWVKIDPANIRQYEGIGAYGNSIKMGLNNKELIFTFFGIVDIPSGLIVPMDDAWHHTAAIWEPGVGVTFYLDGATSFVAETRSPNAYNNNYLTIGAERVTGTALQGSIDRFRVHKAALTAEQLDSVANAPKAPLTSTLVAYHFNETAAPFQSAATTARPAITSNEYLEMSSRPSFITDSPSGKTGDTALSFAAGQRVVVDDSNLKLQLDPNDPSFTLQAWVKLAGMPATRQVLFFNNGPGGAISFSVNTDRTVHVTTLGVLDATSTAVIPDDGAWHHIAVVHENGKEIRYYVDGILGHTRPYTGSVIFTRTDTSFYLGSEPSGSLQYTGALDRLKVTSGILTPEQLDSWPVPGVQPGSPELSIQTVLQVSWPTTPAGYTLQSSTDLNEPKNWSNVTNTPSVGNGKFYLLTPPSQNKVFYRLYKP